MPLALIALAAAVAPVADPAAHFAAFQHSCLAAYPDFDAIGRAAVADGWQDSALRIVEGNAEGLPQGLPRAFRKNGMMLFLTTLDSGQRVCQVAGTAATKLTGAEVGAVVGPLLQAGEPVSVKTRDADKLEWTNAAGAQINAGIAIYGRMRTLSMTITRKP